MPLILRVGHTAVHLSRSGRSALLLVTHEEERHRIPKEILTVLLDAGLLVLYLRSLVLHRGGKLSVAVRSEIQLLVVQTNQCKVEKRVHDSRRGAPQVRQNSNKRRGWDSYLRGRAKTNIYASIQLATGGKNSSCNGLTGM